jgi:hypothetical protein
MRSRRAMIGRVALGVAVVLVVCGTTVAGATQVWSGRTHFFQKVNSTDWTLPENQDRITNLVRITRANTQGIFNIAQETDYTSDVSPTDTEWATGNAVDWATLSFAAWEVWNEAFPPGMVGLDAVVHLITDNIYIDIRFESWTQGPNGGGFSYYRAPDPSLVQPRAWSAIKALYR